jgi:hypothetical protein
MGAEFMLLRCFSTLLGAAFVCKLDVVAEQPHLLAHFPPQLIAGFVENSGAGTAGWQ